EIHLDRFVITMVASSDSPQLVASHSTDIRPQIDPSLKPVEPSKSAKTGKVVKRKKKASEGASVAVSFLSLKILLTKIFKIRPPFRLSQSQRRRPVPASFQSRLQFLRSQSTANFAVLTDCKKRDCFKNPSQI